MIEEWTNADFDALLDGGLVAEDDGASPLTLLGRRIAGQYVDVLVPFAQEVFRGPPGEAAVTALTEGMAALTRLVSATHDEDFLRQLEQMPSLIERASCAHPAQRSGFLRDMRSWILGIADLLDETDGQRLRTQFDADAGDAPLLQHLRDLPGMGKRRVQRLYCAGLYTAAALGGADPQDVSAVTGIPVTIARRCVQASQEFADQQRRTLVERLSRDVTRLLAMAQGAEEDVDEILALVHESISTLQRAATSMQGQTETPTHGEI
ncbi:MAG: hypothetical protein KTR31_40685 [Myxococcales bacterium]|nr:hypothetical protein [Myxococcales bacterium]